MNNPNSKQVTIFRTNSFMTAAQGPDAAGYLATMKRSIGSNFEGGGSKKVSSGLTFAEEDLLLPRLLEVDASDREFNKKRTEFFCDIDTAVDYAHGRTLEIGLENSNTDAVSKSNMPINLMDYIRYRHALKHPQVAASKEEATGNQMIEFYIFDKTKVQANSDLKLELQDSAMKAYLEMEGNQEKVTQGLTLLGISVVGTSGLLKPGEQKQLLKDYAVANPDKFLEMYDTKDFEITYNIKNMLNLKVLKKLGDKYFEAETDVLIANSMEELIWFFKDDLNSDRIVSLKAQTQEKKNK